MNDIPKVYLAGPDVFLPNAKEFGEKKQQICERYGLIGVFPLDADLQKGDLTDREFAFAISEANERLIRACQAVIANMTPFRGPSMDVGTAFEMGYGRALGLVVFGYSNVAEGFAERTRESSERTYVKDGFERDQDDMQVESFGLADNLMLEGAIHSSKGVFICRSVPTLERYVSLQAFEECVALAAKCLRTLGVGNC